MPNDLTLGPWKRWFAWYPVRIGDSMAWLRTIRRRAIYAPSMIAPLAHECAELPPVPWYYVSPTSAGAVKWLAATERYKQPVVIIADPAKIELIPRGATVILAEDAEGTILAKEVDRLASFSRVIRLGFQPPPVSLGV